MHLLQGSRGSAPAPKRHVPTGGTRRDTPPAASLRNRLLRPRKRGNTGRHRPLHARSPAMVPAQQEARERRSSPPNRAHFSKGRTANVPQRRGSRTRRRNSGRHEFLFKNRANHDRGPQPTVQWRRRTIHAAPYGLPDQVRRQPIQQHAGLSSRYSVCPQHSVQLVHQLHAFRGWARTPSPDDHGSTRQPQATNNGRRGHGHR